MSVLMVSVSGIRGIIGNGLDPEVLVKYLSAYADFCGEGKIVIGRDARITGEMVNNIVSGTLMAKGNDIIDLGICPTPTVLYNVKQLNAVGGIAISASHNPNEWNALKLLNHKGEFMTPDENQVMLQLVEDQKGLYKKWDEVGTMKQYPEGLLNHLNAVLKLPTFDPDKIKARKFRVLLDCVNGAGVYIMPQLLEALGCEIIELGCEKNGIFPRLPEPLPENLTETMSAVLEHKADIGIVVDPDVDRLVIITEKGEPFGEENTVTQAVKFVLSKNPGNVVVNLSTTRAVDDVAKEFGCEVFRSPVGEANVVKKMKDVEAVIGGEGSGGVIYPDLQYGRDALVGTVMILQQLAESGETVSSFRKALPQYFIRKNKIELGKADPAKIIEILSDKYSSETINTLDGLRIDFDDHWVHFRKSNTEPIIRCIVEANTEEKAEELIEKYFDEIRRLL